MFIFTRAKVKMNKYGFAIDLNPNSNVPLFTVRPVTCRLEMYNNHIAQLYIFFQIDASLREHVTLDMIIFKFEKDMLGIQHQSSFQSYRSLHLCLSQQCAHNQMSRFAFTKSD